MMSQFFVLEESKWIKIGGQLGKKSGTTYELLEM